MNSPVNCDDIPASIHERFSRVTILLTLTFFLLTTGLLMPPHLLGAEEISSPSGSQQQTQTSSFSKANKKLLTGDELLRVEKKLESIWAGYRSEVATAEIDYLSIGFTLKTRELTCDQFCDEIRQTKLVAEPELTRRVVEQFCPEKLDASETDIAAMLKAVGDWRTFRHQGNERRCLSPVFEYLLTDELHLLVDHPNEDIHAYRRGNCPYWFELWEWFRTVPDSSLFESSRLLQPSPGQYKIEYGGRPKGVGVKEQRSWLTIDPDDGLPREWRLVSPSTGEVVRLELYLEMTTWPGNVTCPAVRVEANFANQKLTTVQMSVIRSARFNMSFDDDAFRLSAPAGWVWVDRQLDVRDSGRWEKPVDDVVEFFKNRTASPAAIQVVQEEAVDSTEWRSILLIFNGVILIVIGIVLWRRST